MEVEGGRGGHGDTNNHHISRQYLARSVSTLSLSAGKFYKFAVCINLVSQINFRKDDRANNLITVNVKRNGNVKFDQLNTADHSFFVLSLKWTKVVVLFGSEKTERVPHQPGLLA